MDDTKPLWLPTGSVRALLALTILSAYVYMCIVTGNVEALGLVAVMVAKDYFETKKLEQKKVEK